MKNASILTARIGYAAIALGLLAGCSEKPAAAPTPLRPHAQRFRETQPAANMKLPAVAEKANWSAVQVDEEIAKACNMPTAYFEISGGASLALQVLATCFTSGPMKDKSLKIVGHADPRGTSDYNFGLGQRRAGNVAAFLMDKGLPEARIVTTSMGELEATGTDETSWSRDRKVEILLADKSETDDS
jgi:peptidoglycan-associated lipoprotein